MEPFTDVLLVTANVGSLFDNVGKIQSEWLQELYKTVHTYKPQFIGLHFQEVGGKDYTANMDHAESFFRSIKSSVEMKEYDRTRIYIDNQFQTEDSFTGMINQISGAGISYIPVAFGTEPHAHPWYRDIRKALGSMYFIHKTLKDVSQYDFNAKDFRPASGREAYVGSMSGVATVEKEKFPKDFWPDFKWSRKGFMRTRWIIRNQGLDLVNVHLFHDASNLIACESSPSVYSANRRNALRYVISRMSDSCCAPLPFFLFGDFNFRLDTLSLVQHLCISADVQTVMKDSSNRVQKIICEEKDNDRQVLLQIEEKLFAYVHQAAFREDNGRALLKYDKEAAAFHDVIGEEDIRFPPSYPYSEDHSKPTQYMNTRCPAWCDRILMSHSAQDLIHRSDGETSLVYNTMGPNVCMGDHKPVFLFFPMKTNDH